MLIDQEKRDTVTIISEFDDKFRFGDYLELPTPLKMYTGTLTSNTVVLFYAIASLLPKQLVLIHGLPNDYKFKTI